MELKGKRESLLPLKIFTDCLFTNRNKTVLSERGDIQTCSKFHDKDFQNQQINPKDY